jgi:hypothetical protein
LITESDVCLGSRIISFVAMANHFIRTWMEIRNTAT